MYFFWTVFGKILEKRYVRITSTIKFSILSEIKRIKMHVKIPHFCETETSISLCVKYWLGNGDFPIMTSFNSSAE